MCKSSSLAFVLIFAFLFRLESPTWRLVAIIATMTLGVVMMVAGEVEFKLGGFLLVISAAFFSGFRWGLTQILLLRNPATSNPFSSIFFLAPIMFATLFVIAIPSEGFGPLVEGLRGLVAEFGPFYTPLLILFPGTIAFLMTASEVRPASAHFGRHPVHCGHLQRGRHHICRGHRFRRHTYSH